MNIRQPIVAAAMRRLYAAALASILQLGTNPHSVARAAFVTAAQPCALSGANTIMPEPTLDGSVAGVIVQMPDPGPNPNVGAQSCAESSPPVAKEVVEITVPETQPIAGSSSNTSVAKSTPSTDASAPSRCYIASIPETADSGKIWGEVRQMSSSVQYAYTKYITGISFCTSNVALVNAIKGKYSFLDIEDDSLFRIGSVENDRRLRRRRQSCNNNTQPELQKSAQIPAQTPDTYTTGATGANVQSPVPIHFYRMENMGGLFFNNYLLDNAVFRILRINYMIKYFYNYTFMYTGRGVKIAKIDVDDNAQKNAHGRTVTDLLVGPANSFAKSAVLTSISKVASDGTIRLSSLLDILQNAEPTDVLFLPVYGPRSNALDALINKIGQRTVVVAAAGNNGEDSCNYSPNGAGVIKVGAVTKHGSVDTYSNHGSCNRIYALGDGFSGDSGTSYAAALVASMAALYLEKNPGSSAQQVAQFLINGALTNNNQLPIAMVPPADLVTDWNTKQSMYHPFWSLVVLLIFYGLLVLLCYYCIRKFMCRGRSGDRHDELLHLEPSEEMY